MNLLKRFTSKKLVRNELLISKETILQNPIPEHIAIIMDGNGRWAKKRGLPRVAGHHEGMQVVRKITKLANELGVKVLTLYAFSTENWKRPQTEVDFLMKLPEEFLNIYLPELVKENVQVKVMGVREGLPKHTRSAVEKAMEQTSQNDGLILNFALNYGSRDEILSAIKSLSHDIQKQKVNVEDVTEDLFTSYLMTHSMSDPEFSSVQVEKLD